jgi:hypothetical protein
MNSLLLQLSRPLLLTIINFEALQLDKSRAGSVETESNWNNNRRSKTKQIEKAVASTKLNYRFRPY